MIRMMIALVASMVIVLLMGPKFIPFLKKMSFGQTIYDLGPQTHKTKQGTPVMGGLMMAAAITVVTLAAHPARWQGGWDFVIPLLGVALLSMLVGFADDFIKAVKKRHEGLTPWQKIAGQVITALGFSVYCYFNPSVGSSVQIPFFHIEWDLGIFYIPLMTLLVIFIVNSSNLQDGLDGLLSTVTVSSSTGWAMVCVLTMLLGAGVTGNSTETANLQTIGIFAMAMTGACIGFLRFNRYPAKTFMGDTGSMLLGGGTVAIAMLLRQPFMLLFMFFCPIMSSVSVILQRYYFKLTHGKRIFKMSPIHHHFELSGYSETQIVAMYASITTVLSLIAVLSVCC